MNHDQRNRLTALETEDQRLKRVVADQSLDKMILTGAAGGKLPTPSRQRPCIDRLRQPAAYLGARFAAH
jgi:putative transposase